MKFITALLALIATTAVSVQADSANDPDLVYARSYIAITAGADFTTITPDVATPDM
jgi:hypothetical protein